MSAGKYIIGASVIAGGVFLASKVIAGAKAVRVAQNAMVRIVGVKNLKLGFNGLLPTLKFVLQVECTNPTGQSAQFDTFAINLQDGPDRIGSKVWAQVRYAGPVRMQSRELTKIVEIPGNVNLTAPLLSVLVGPSVLTLVNRLREKKDTQKEEPKIEGVITGYYSVSENYGNLGAVIGDDKANLLANIKKAIPKELFVVGNVRVNTFLIPLSEKVKIG